MRLALVIGVALAVLQQVTGINVFLYYAPEIFKSIGAGHGRRPAADRRRRRGQHALHGRGDLDRGPLGRKPLMIVGSPAWASACCRWAWRPISRRTDAWVLVFVLGYIACFALSVVR